MNASRMVAETRRSRFIPPVWVQVPIVVGAVVVAAVLQSVLFLVPSPEAWNMAWDLFATAVLIAVILVVAIPGFRRSPASLGIARQHAVRHYVLGAGVGVAWLAVVIGILAATGHVRAWTWTGWSGLIGVLVVGFVVQSFSEELLARGWLMPWVAARTTIPAGVVVNSVLFGLLHLLNPAVSVVGVLNVVLVGMFFSLLVLVTDDVWTASGAHWTWNALLGLVVGIEVSGRATPAAGHLELSGATVWTGGDFGLEGSLVVTVVLVAGVAAVVVLVRRRLRGPRASG